VERDIWEAARFLGVVLAVGGIAAILVAARRVRRGDASGKQLRTVGIASLAIGAVATSLAVTYVRSRPREPRPQPAVSTAERFEGSTQPAVRVIAPPGWRVSFDDATRRVTVERGDPSIDDNWAALAISSSVLNERADLGRMAAMLRDLPAPIDAEIMDGPTMTELGGLPALRTTLKHANAGLAEVVWQVDRGGRYTSQVHCMTQVHHRPDHACESPLRSLRWIEPTDVGGAARR
jgi:membrane protein implicated in regulation of membrane protease activity